MCKQSIAHNRLILLELCDCFGFRVPLLLMIKIIILNYVMLFLAARNQNKIFKFIRSLPNLMIISSELYSLKILQWNFGPMPRNTLIILKTVWNTNQCIIREIPDCSLILLSRLFPFSWLLGSKILCLLLTIKMVNKTHWT